MSWKINLSREEADKWLESADPRLEFGNTVMGIVDLEGKKVAFGRRYFTGMEPAYFEHMGLLGPDSLDLSDEYRFATQAMERLIERLEKAGSMDQFDAVVTDSYATFSIFREGLIVDNYLAPTKEGVAEGKIIIKGKLYKLLVVDGNGVFGHDYNSLAVNANRSMLDI